MPSIEERGGVERVAAEFQRWLEFCSRVNEHGRWPRAVNPQGFRSLGFKPSTVSDRLVSPENRRSAVARGARIVSPPTDYPYGERQYTAVDLGGHHWTFSQSLADVDPADWGGVLVDV